MTEIHISFAEDVGDLVDRGVKTATTRKSKKGDVGDVFEYRGKTYEITDVEETELLRVLERYREEGYRGYCDFYEALVRFYPEIKHCDHPLWFHRFRRVQDMEGR